MALVPAIDLGRRTWTPTEILDDDGKVIFGTDRLNTSAVRFAGGIADGRSICRGFEGGSLRSGLALSAFDLVPDRQRLPQAARRRGTQQPGRRGRLPGHPRDRLVHALRGSELELMDVEGRPVMRLVPQSELVGPTWVRRPSWT